MILYCNALLPKVALVSRTGEALQTLTTPSTSLKIFRKLKRRYLFCNQKSVSKKTFYLEAIQYPEDENLHWVTSE